MTFDVIEILNRYNIDYQEDKYSSEIKILCPFHNDNHYGSAMINNDSGLFNCYSCGEKGNIYQFVAMLEGISNADAYKLIASNFNESAYNIESLKKIKIKIKTQEDKSRDQLQNKVLTTILEGSRFMSSIENKAKWLIVCNWVKFHCAKEKQLLEIYSLFNKELKSYGKQTL